MDNLGGLKVIDPYDMLTISQVAQILQKNDKTVRDYLDKYKIPHVKRKEGYKRPRRIYIMRRDLEQFIYGQWNNGK